MKFAKLTDPSGKEVYVNPDLVTFVREASDKGITIVNFSQDHSATVRGTAAEIASMLFNAGKL